MPKVKDKFILGFMAGVIATIIFNGIDYLSLRLHVNNWHMWQLAGSLYFNKNELATIPALILGAFTHTTLMGLCGIIICYFTHTTTRSKNMYLSPNWSYFRRHFN